MKIYFLFIFLLFFNNIFSQNAQFVSQTPIPTELEPGEQFTVSITMKNTGSETWYATGTNPCKLGSQNPQDNWNWGTNRIYLSHDVAVGEEYTFTKTFTAPTTNGIYNFQWQMVKENTGWFGDFTPNVEILVSNYSLVGSTIASGGNCYEITRQTADVGAIWYKEKINLNHSFDINFTLNIDLVQGAGADGMMFVLQNVGTDTVGYAGGSLGYFGIGDKSLGVEFDVYNNRESCGLGNWSDTLVNFNGEMTYVYEVNGDTIAGGGPETYDCSDHTAISRNGNVKCEIAAPVSLFPDGRTIENDSTYQCRIKWNPQTDSIHVYINCILRIATKYDIINDIFDGENMVYWGFTASTGPYDADRIRVCLDGNIFSALEDKYICVGDSIQLDIGGGTYGNPTWSPDYNIDDIHSSTPIVQPVVDTTYYLSYQHPECLDYRYDSVRIHVKNPTATLTGGGDICDDGSTSNLILDFTGDADWTYNWTLNGTPLSQGIASNSHNVIPVSDAGIYQLTSVTDSMGCSANIINGSAIVTVNQLPTPNINGNLYFCEGQSTTLDAGTYDSYLWNTGETTQAITVDTAGQYIVTVTDNNSCSNSDTVQVIANPLPNISITALPDTQICFGDTIILDASASTGSGNLSYSWSTFADSATIQIVPPNDTILYLNVIDTNLCQSTDSVEIVVNELPYFSSATIVDVTNCVTHNGEITVNADGGLAPYTYNINGSTFSSVNHWDTLNSIVYTYGITDANGCQYFQNYAIPNSSGIYIDTVTYDPILCYGDTTSIIITPSVSGNIFYSISTPVSYSSDSIFSNLTAGNYQINIIDSTTNCEAGYPLTITQPSELTLIGFDYNTICDTANGMIYVDVSGGTPSYTYNWSDYSVNSDTLDNLPAGNYSVTVTDSNNCKDSVNFVVEDQSKGTIRIDSIRNVLCYGDSSAIIYSSIIGGNPNYNFNWYSDTSLISSVSNSGNTNQLINIPEGYYSLQVIDNMNCVSNYDSIYVSQPTALELSHSLEKIMCHDDKSGSITVNAIGGTQPYRYLWSTNSTDSTITNLDGGVYSVTVVDKNNCINTIEDIELINPEELILQIDTIGNLSCYQSNDGEISFDVEGGTPGYIYKLNGEELYNTSISNLESGIYLIEVRDSNQCVKTDTVELTQPDRLILIDSLSENNIYTQAIGGTLEYYYIWNTGETSQNITNLPTGIYTITVTDKNNCEVTDTFKIEAPLLIPTVITPNNDGFNDTWDVKGLLGYDEISINIFNRWGDKIFSFEGSGVEYNEKSVQWDGTWNDKELPLGTYVYILKIKDIDESFNGTITIIR